MKTNFMRLSSIGMIALGVGCTTGTTSSGGEVVAQANALGIVTYQITETSDQLTMIGVDAAGQAVATVDLFRGNFELSDYFAATLDDGDSRLVDGRRLEIDVVKDGVSTPWSYETSGNYPVMHMPYPVGLAEIVAKDPSVKEHLAHFDIGQDWSVVASTEVPYSSVCSNTYQCYEGAWPSSNSGQSITSNMSSATFMNPMTNPYTGKSSSSVLCGGHSMYSGTMVGHYNATGLWYVAENALLQVCNGTGSPGYDFWAVQTCLYNSSYAQSPHTACDGSTNGQICAPCSGPVQLKAGGVASYFSEGFNTPDDVDTPMYSLWCNGCAM